MFDTAQEILGVAMLEELFGKFDFLGVADLSKAIETYKIYLAAGEVETGLKIIILSGFLLALRITLITLAVIFVLRVWKIVSYHYFKILDEEKEKKIRKEFFARKEPVVEEIAPKMLEKVEVVKQPEETKEIEIPVPMGATKEAEIPKQNEKPKEKRTLKEKVVGFLFNE